MEVGISEAAALLWQVFDPESYNEAFLYIDDEKGYWFTELPSWADDPKEGPFYIDEDGAIWAISMRPSQKGEFIGNLL